MSPLELALKSALLIGLAGLAALALGRASAALRHRVWAIAFMGLAVLPLLIGRVPHLDVHKAPRKAVVSGQVVASAPPKGNVSVVHGQTAAVAETVAAASSSSRSAVPELALLWAIGTIVSAGTTLGMLFVVRGFARQGADLAVDPAFGIPPHTRVRRTSAVDVPLTFGALRPTILLPEASAEWSAERLQAVLFHESAHIRRGDWAWLVFSRLVCGLYWFNPLVWFAFGRLRAESEGAADDAVLHAGIPAAQYAETLVELAALTRQGRFAAAALPIVERATLKSRVAEILKSAKSRRPLGRGAASLALAVGSAAVATFAATRIVEGPLVAEKGVIELDGGHTARVVAITEIRDGKAVSWDMNGARLAEPYPIDQEQIRSLEFVSGQKAAANQKIRYLIVRTDAPGVTLPTLYDRPGGQVLLSQPLSGLSVNQRYYERRDGLDRPYYVIRLAVPPQDSAYRFFATRARGEWTRLGMTEYQKGAERRIENSDLRIRLTPAFQVGQFSSRIEAVLPAGSASRITEVRVTPSGDRSYLEGLTGPVETYSQTRPDLVRRVEILQRPLETVEVGDIPLAPKPKAVAIGDRFEPDNMVVAKNGRAELSGGAVIELAAVKNFESGEAQVYGGFKSSFPDGKIPWKPNFLKIVPIPGTVPLEAFFRSNDQNDGSIYGLFESDGRQIPSEERVKMYLPQTNAIGYSIFVQRGRSAMDFLMKVPNGKYQKVFDEPVGGPYGLTGEYRRQKPGDPGFRVSIPELGKLVADMDVRISALDGAGHPLSIDSYTWSESFVQFSLSEAQARQIRRVVVSSRPYQWVKFPKVQLPQ